MAAVLRWYQKMLKTKPLATQMVSSGIIGATGDVVCQFAFEKRTANDYDVKRTARFFVLTFGFIAPVLSRWLFFLETRIQGTSKLMPLKRVFIDQLCFAPVFSATIMYNLHLLEHFDLGRAWDLLKRDYWQVYKHSIKYWPCVQIINFYLMPLNFRVVFVQIAALAWNTFLSFKTQGKVSLPPLE